MNEPALWKGTNMQRRLPGVLGLVVTGMLSAGMYGCAGPAEPVKSAEPPAVSVVTPKRQTLTRMILQPGFVKAYEQTPIYARIQGYVEEVKADIGDHVKKGQLLAKLRVPEWEKDWQAKIARVEQAAAQIDQAKESWEAAKANVETAKAQVGVAKAGVDRAEAEYQRWQAEFDRGKKMLAGSVYDKQSLDVVLYQMQAQDAARAQAKENLLSTLAVKTESEAKSKKAAADVQATLASKKVAEADRDQTKVWYDYREIRAPFDGVVTLRNVHTGHFLQVAATGNTNKSADALFNVVRVDKVRVNVQVPEYDAPLVKEGAAAVITFWALKGEEFAGTVTRFTEVLDDQARTLRVEIHLPNPGERLLPGMYVNAAIKTEQAGAMTLPAEAIFTDGENRYCFVVDPQTKKAVLTAVRVGVSNDELVQVLKKQTKSGQWEDFTGNEWVVSSNPESLIDGQVVTATTETK
jgi:HlyD family secretion protein